MSGIESPTSDSTEGSMHGDLIGALLKNSISFGEGQFRYEENLWAPYEIVLDESDPALMELCVTALAPVVIRLTRVKRPKHILIMPGIVDPIIDGVKDAFAAKNIKQQVMRYRSDQQAGNGIFPRITSSYLPGETVVAVTVCAESVKAKNKLVNRCKRERLPPKGHVELISTGEFTIDNQNTPPSGIYSAMGVLSLASVLDRARDEGIINDRMHGLCMDWPKRV